MLRVHYVMKYTSFEQWGIPVFISYVYTRTVCVWLFTSLKVWSTFLKQAQIIVQNKNGENHEIQRIIYQFLFYNFPSPSWHSTRHNIIVVILKKI